MSPWRRTNSASVAIASSMRFFSRLAGCDRSGFDQRFGSEACFSISASWTRSLPASKVLLEGMNFSLERGVLLFEVFDHGLGLCLSRWEAHDQRSYGNYRTQEGEPVAVAGVEGSYLGECVGSHQSRAGLALETRDDPAVGLD